MGKVSLRLAGWLVVATLLLPATAHAGIIAVNLSVQGAGSVTVTWSSAGAVCLNPSLTNTGEHPCGLMVDDPGFFGQSHMVLDATPRPRGGWTFAGWQL